MPKSRDSISLFRQLDNDYAAILHKKLNQYAKQEESAHRERVTSSHS